MHHIFQVHNFISVSLAREYIKKHCLPFNKCVFIYWRGSNIYKKKTDEFEWKEYTFAQKNIDFREFTDYSLIDFSKIFQYKKIIREFNHWIKKVCRGEAFLFYTPHLAYVRDRIIISQKKCQGFFFIEEGLMSYHTKISNHKLTEIITFKEKIKSVIIFNNFIYLKESIFPEGKKFKGAISISKESFKGFQNQIIVGIPFEKKEYPEELENILILDDYRNEKDVYEKNYYSVINLLLNQIVFTNKKNIYFKVHPGFEKDKNALKKISLYLKSKEQELNIKIIKLSKSYSLENIAFSLGNKVSFYGVYSAAMLYAHFCNSNTFFYTHELAKIDLNFSKLVNHNSDSYANNIPIYFSKIASKNKYT